MPAPSTCALLARVEVYRRPPTCAARRGQAPKRARSEPSASTSVHALPDARIITGGPIAPDGLRHESADSRRASGRVPSRRARFRRAEPGGGQRHTFARATSAASGRTGGDAVRVTLNTVTITVNYVTDGCRIPLF